MPSRPESTPPPNKSPATCSSRQRPRRFTEGRNAALASAAANSLTRYVRAAHANLLIFSRNPGCPAFAIAPLPAQSEFCLFLVLNVCYRPIGHETLRGLQTRYKCSVPRPCAFFLAQGRESTDLIEPHLGHLVSSLPLKTRSSRTAHTFARKLRRSSSSARNRSVETGVREPRILGLEAEVFAQAAAVEKNIVGSCGFLSTAVGRRSAN